MSSPIPLDLQAKIANWRIRAAEGTLTLEEMKEAVVFLRAGRLSAANAAATSKRKASSAAPSADSMLDELENL